MALLYVKRGSARGDECYGCGRALALLGRVLVLVRILPVEINCIKLIYALVGKFHGGSGVRRKGKKMLAKLSTKS